MTVSPFWGFRQFRGCFRLCREGALQRLFSTFPSRWPGAGLLLLRLAAGVPLIIRGTSELQGAPQPPLLMLAGVTIARGGFVLFSLCTPFAAAAEALLDLCRSLSRTSHYET